MGVLSVSHLTKKFGEFRAVSDISFSLERGEILGVLGPNGAGKTTTIQMLLGVLKPTSGKIVYFGKDLSKSKTEIAEKINFSSTYISLPRRLTVKEDLTFISYLYDIKDRRTRLARIRKMFRLDEIWNSQVFSLSAGQSTRLNLAKAWINFPEVLLLDEPTASLDPEVADYIRKFLLKQREKFNISVIITSHNMAEIEEVCDRVIFINHGKIIAEGTPYSLARTMDVSHIKLLIKDGVKRTVEICKKQGLNYIVSRRHITIDIEQHKIPTFLENLLSKGIIYEDISIDKPSLEDYFLEIAKRDDKNK